MEVETGSMNPAALMDATVGMGRLGQARREPDKVDQLLEDWVAVGCSMVFV